MVVNIDGWQCQSKVQNTNETSMEEREMVDEMGVGRMMGEVFPFPHRDT